VSADFELGGGRRLTLPRQSLARCAVHGSEAKEANGQRPCRIPRPIQREAFEICNGEDKDKSFKRQQREQELRMYRGRCTRNGESKSRTSGAREGTPLLSPGRETRDPAQKFSHRAAPAHHPPLTRAYQDTGTAIGRGCRQQDLSLPALTRSCDSGIFRDAAFQADGSPRNERYADWKT